MMKGHGQEEGAELCIVNNIWVGSTGKHLMKLGLMMIGAVRVGRLRV